MYPTTIETTSPPQKISRQQSVRSWEQLGDMDAWDELSLKLESQAADAGIATEEDVVRYIKEEIRPIVYAEWNKKWEQAEE